MAWVKRNLYFLVGGVVAIALLGMAGYYFYSKWALNSENQVKLNQAYAELIQVGSLSPNPGNDKVNNTQNAREQQKQLRDIIEKERKYFVSPTPIPNSQGKAVTKEEFASALRRTVDELQRAADNASVALPSKYNFSFQAQRDITTFVPGSLEPLSEQLGDIKAICAVLFGAKINSLENLRRSRISDDDLKGQQSDYLDPSVTGSTNDLAVMTPYEVSFRCFSAELAGVLEGFSNSRSGSIVKTINVEPAGSAVGMGADQAPGAYPGYPPAGNPGYNRRFNEDAPAVAAAPVVVRGGLPVLLDEKPLKVTMMVTMVKLLPPK